MLLRFERAHRQVGNAFVEYRRVARHAHVRKASAHAAAALRMPPVLHVALDELTRRGAQDVGARDIPFRVHERQGVLKLIAESERAAALIECRASPHTAGERLIETPAIEHHIERGLRRANGDHRQPLLPRLDGAVDRRRGA